MCICATSLTFSSCSKDDGDDVVESNLADYYISFELVNAGSLSPSDANSLIGELNAEARDLKMNAYTRDEAVYTFDKFVRNLKDDLDEAHSFTISFNCKLMTGSKTVKQTLFEITKTGCITK